MLPMNAMAQKVVPGSESGSMKPLSGTGLSYVTLQPPSQPLSLVQDHRPSVYQTPPYIGSNVEEPETEKLIPNGVEITKTETEQDVPAVTKQNESNRNNNLSPENPAQEQPCEIQPEQVLTSLMDFPLSTPLSTPAQNKVEEKKAPVNNGSKESDGKAVNTPVHIKQSPHKPEDVQAKNEVPKAKPTNQSLKVPNDNAAATLTSTHKPDAKVTTSPKTTKRKSRELKDLKATSAVVADGASKPKRNRIQTQPYQSPLPEIALLVKSLNKTPGSKAADDKLIVFYKNEFLAVRNAEGSFYVCQAMQNIYKSSRRIRIRWLSQDKNNGEFYSPDFYDNIDFDCILTNLNLNKVDKQKFWLTRIELLRTENILKRAIDVEAGVSEKPRVTEEHPDGLDLSLYKDESQLKRRKGLHNEKPSQRKKSKRAASSTDDDADEEESDRIRKTSKASRVKKRSVNKALAIAKSVAKGTSRAERALNRSTKSGNSLGNDIVTTTAAVTTTATITTTITTTAAVATTTTTATTAAAAASVTTTTTTSTTVNPATNVSTVADAKNNAESKKLDLKKNGKQQSNNSIRGVPRTKLGGK
ncbi:micronuclear linker histone polyprotein isoform x3 [Lasius niger]|uniref:Micronuclear linker histone polyprotein isoform x3 n=1 Tax=Lasius niger TaxID=67767 RepID=A0A0J7L5W2_LASNI|nr:micronuclear linker histone polyprotein isoform x3 [Lasius niger]